MLIRLIRTTIVPVWFVAFGLLALLWSPMTVGDAMLLLTMGVVGPATVLILAIRSLQKRPLPQAACAIEHTGTSGA
jgi:hypothetical protein